MEKRIARIQRWLDRLTVACKSSAWGSALTEVECLEAEVRSVRGEIWDKAVFAKQEAARAAYRPVFLGRVSLVAFLLLFFFSPQLAPESEHSRGGFTKSEPAGAFVWVTYDENKVLDALRRDLSENNVGALPDASREQRANPEPKGMRVAVRQEEKESTAVHESRNKDSALQQPKELVVEDVLSLIQIGQKALHRGDPAVEVIP